MEAVQKNYQEQIKQAQGEVKKELEKKHEEFKDKYVEKYKQKNKSDTKKQDKTEKENKKDANNDGSDTPTSSNDIRPQNGDSTHSTQTTDTENNTTTQKNDNIDTTKMETTSIPTKKELEDCIMKFNTTYQSLKWKNKQAHKNNTHEIITKNQINCKDEKLSKIIEELSKAKESYSKAKNNSARNKYSEKIEKIEREFKTLTKLIVDENKKIEEDDNEEIINFVVNQDQNPKIYYDNSEWKLCSDSMYSEIKYTSSYLYSYFTLEKHGRILNSYNNNTDTISNSDNNKTDILIDTQVKGDDVVIIYPYFKNFEVYTDQQCIEKIDKVSVYLEYNSYKLCNNEADKLTIAAYNIFYTNEAHSNEITNYTYNGLYLDKDTIQGYTDQNCQDTIQGYAD